MRSRDATVGVFLIAGLVLFSLGIFLMGSQRKTFTQNFEVYTEFADVNGLMKGAKVQVAGSGRRSDGYSRSRIARCSLSRPAQN